MCQPAAPHEIYRRSILCHSVSRVPLPVGSSSHRISWNSSTLGASARVTLASETLAVPTQVSVTVFPTASRLPSASKGAHSRRCAGSVSACQTFSGAWRRSLTRMSVHFSPSFRTCASLAGPGVYCSRCLIVLPARQLGELNQIAAGVLQHRDDRGGHVGGRHRELRTAGLDPLIVALDVVGEEHGRGLALLKQRQLIRLGRGIVVQSQLQLRAVWLVGRCHGQPAKRAITEIGLFGKTQYLRIEAQSLVLIVHVYAGQFYFHLVSPLSRSRFGPRRLFLAIHAVVHPIEVALQSIHMSGPEPAEWSQPGIHLLKWLRPQPVEAALRIHRRFHETGVAQHPQVLDTAGCGMRSRRSISPTDCCDE